jgi:hypothetical protein
MLLEAALSQRNLATSSYSAQRMPALGMLLYSGLVTIWGVLSGLAPATLTEAMGNTLGSRHASPTFYNT